MNIVVPLGDPRDVLFLFWRLFVFFSFSFPQLCAVNIDMRNILTDVIKGEE